MTYCAALCLDEGLVFGSDTRTNAGIDHIATFRKLYRFGVADERVIILQTSGNLATSQAVIQNLQRAIDEAREVNLNTVPTLFEAAKLVGECSRQVAKEAAELAGSNSGFTSNFLLGGQIKGQPPALFTIYREGNCVSATPDTPYFQIGESKYGKPILDRAITPATSLEQGLRALLVSFDSTLRSNLSVGLPIDIAIYKTDSLVMPEGMRIEADDPYFLEVNRLWASGLQSLLGEIPPPPTTFYG